MSLFTMLQNQIHAYLTSEMNENWNLIIHKIQEPILHLLTGNKVLFKLVYLNPLIFNLTETR